VPFIKNFIRDEEGQDVVEYAIVIGLVALSGATVVGILTGGITNILTSLSAALTGVTFAT
jgi:pilus assembly protein Flp/PilA